ncbi:MAG TPA: hypothetical protein VGO87_02015 [Acidimicrobiia bacterium]
MQTGLPLRLVGYSFGADIALSVGDERVTGWAAVAPPLRVGPPPCAAEGVDHFLAGAAGRVAEAVLAWLRDESDAP